MSATERHPKPRQLPLGDALQPTIDRMRAIATAATDALLTEGPVHPDHQLLDACSGAMHLFKLAEAAHAERKAAHDRAGTKWTAENRANDDRLIAEHRMLDAQGARILRRVKKLAAVTPAGIYAKAVLVRSSKTGAAELAMSLADDLIGCTELRASLWPAGEGV